MYSFPNLEPVSCSMSSFKGCFLTCIQISQKADKVVWCSRVFKNFLQFVLIHIVKDFGVVNKAEVDVFLELSCFFYDPTDVGNLISGSSAFSKSSLNIWKFLGLSDRNSTSYDQDGHVTQTWPIRASHVSGCNDCQFSLDH